MFTPRQNTTILSAAAGQLQLIYHQAAYELRKGHRNALVGLVLTASQSIIMIAGFMALFMIVGIRSSPVRGDYLIFMMSGIFLFITHIQTIAAVAGSTKANRQMIKHGPMSTAVLISAAALAILYRQIFASTIILTAYYLYEPFTVVSPVGCLAMLLLSWGTGVAIGTVLLALQPWMPQAVTVMTQILQRANMVFSGKMFLANVLPSMMFKMFAWNPLFHVIDQARGYAFINYNPLKTSLTYPIYFMIAVMMVGLIAEFVTRKYESLSWSATH